MRSFHLLFCSFCLFQRSKNSRTYISTQANAVCMKEELKGYYEGTVVKIIPPKNSIIILSEPTHCAENLKVGEVIQPSRDYEVNLSVQQTQRVGRWSVLVRFTADVNSKMYKAGDRSPAILFPPGSGQLEVCQSTTTNGNLNIFTKTHLAVNQKYHVRIVTANDQVQVYIDDVFDSSRYAPLNERPQLPKLDVYLDDPFDRAAEAIVNDLSFTPLPREISDWTTCAIECESNNECEFWNFDNTQSLCKLMKNKQGFQQDDNYSSGSPSQCDCVDNFSIDISFQMADNPQYLSWQIKEQVSNEVIATSGDNFAASAYKLKSYSLCLDLGTYIFEVKNTIGAGLASFEYPIGSYEVLNQDKVLISGDPYFGHIGTNMFGFCENDQHCTSTDSCLEGSCELSTKTCIFERVICSSCMPNYEQCEQKGTLCVSSECSQCGLNELFISIRTDWFPQNLTWSLTSLQTQDIIREEAPFSSSKYELYEYKYCLEPGVYEFQMISSSGLGLSDGIDGNYQIKVNGIHRDSGGGSETWFEEVKEIIICAEDIDCQDNDPCFIKKCNKNLAFCYISSVVPSFSILSGCGVVGNATTIALRVSALDTETTSSHDEMRNYIFGTDGNVTMTSQFNACSYGSFRIIPYVTSVSEGEVSSYGVIDIHLNENIINKGAQEVADIAFSEAQTLLGDIESIADFVMICLPPGTIIGTSSDWKAYAFVNSFLSIYNDQNCAYPSVQMHELGHNFGLSHSSDEFNYGDESGAMGISYKMLHGPAKCFNGPKSWDLGWYSDKHLIVDIRSLVKNDVYTNYLIPIVDYGTDQLQQASCILKLINSQDGFDYYVTFNKKSGFNAETSEGADQLLVTRSRASAIFDDSFLVGRLKVDESYVIYNVIEEENLLIFRNMMHGGSSVRVDLRKLDDYCLSDSDCNDFNTCLTSVCSRVTTFVNEKVCVYSKKECSTCGNTVKVSIETNDNPGNLVWDIQDIMTEKILLSSGYFPDPYAKYEFEDCLQFGKYVFSITYNEQNDFLLQNSSFSFYVGEYLMDKGNISGEEYIESFFIICTSDSDCKDYDGCSIDVCDTESKLCNNTNIENRDDCQDCSWFSFHLLTDNYPVETSWQLSDLESSHYVYFGAPYPFELSVSFGRRKAPTKSGRSKAPTKSGRSKAPTRVSTTFKGGAKYDKSDLDYSIQSEDNMVDLEFCLEKNIPYYFVINDSFGDGICCYEGNGFYNISVEGTSLKEGGAFGSKDEFIFEIRDCTSDEDCNDSNPATSDVCKANIGVCAYEYKLCEEYGADFTVIIFSEPSLAEWRVTQNHSKIILEGGPYAELNKEYSKTHCFAFGTYFFQGFDSFNRVMKYCLKGHSCGYRIQKGSLLIKESDNLYVKEELIPFGPCQVDEDCNDVDTCTEDKCDQVNNVCVFNALPCKSCSDDPCNTTQTCIPSPCWECHKCQTSFTIKTDRDPFQNKWYIANESNTTIVSSGPYYIPYTTFSYRDCIEQGAYNFQVEDGNNDGLSFCNFQEGCGYSFVVDGNVVKEEQFYFISKDESFNCSVKDVDDWYIDFIDSKFDNSSNEFELKYHIAKNKEANQFISTIYDEDCINVIGESSIRVVNSSIVRKIVNYDDGLTFLSLDEIGYWRKVSNSTLSTRFCVKSELLVADGSNVSVSFIETKFLLTASLDKKFTLFNIDDTKLMKQEAVETKKIASFLVHACICDVYLQCEENSELEQNSKLYICVYPENENFQVSSFVNVSFVQDGIVKYDPVVKGKDDTPLTKTTMVRSIGVIQTRVLSNFFNEDNPTDLIIVGEVGVHFITNRHLLLEEYDEEKIQYSSSTKTMNRIQRFQLKTKLTKGTKGFLLKELPWFYFMLYLLLVMIILLKKFGMKSCSHHRYQLV